MGVYISCFTDNNIFENDMQTTIEKLAERLKRKIWILGDFNDRKYPDDKVMKDYLIIDLDEENNINESFEKDKSIILSVYDNLFELDHIWITKAAVLLNDFWWKWYVFEDYLLGNNDYFDCKIEAVKHFGKIFNSTEYIIFGDDYYDSEIDNRLSEGEYIKNIINDKKFNIVTEIPITPDELGGYVYYKKYRENIEEEFNYDEWYEYFKHNDINVKYPFLEQDKFIENYPDLIKKHTDLFNGRFYYLENWGNLMYQESKDDKASKTYYIFGILTPEKLAKILEDDINKGVNSIPERFKECEMKDGD